MGYLELLILVKAMREPVRGIGEQYRHPRLFCFIKYPYRVSWGEIDKIDTMKTLALLFFFITIPNLAEAQLTIPSTSFVSSPDFDIDSDIFGDVNKDGKVNVSDIMVIVNHILNNEADYDTNFDIDNNGSINVSDIMIDVSIILGMEVNKYELTYPKYLEDEYKKTVEDVRQVINDSAIVILYATDLHFSYKGSGYAEKALFNPIRNMFHTMKRFEIDLKPNLIFLGGDYIQLPSIADGQTKEMGFKVLDYVNLWINRFFSTKFLIIGNHELNYTGNNTGYGMTVDEFYDYTQKDIVNAGIIKEVGATHKLFYYDDATAKTRHIFVNTPTTEYNDIADEIIEVTQKVPAGWSVIAYNHYVGRDYNFETPVFYNPLKTIIQRIKATDVDFIAWFGAHNHADVCYVQDDMVGISSLQSGAWTPGTSEDGVQYNHSYGTPTESAVTIYVIRKDLGKIYVKRWGLGKDREINYNSKSGNVGLVNWTE